MILCTLRNSSLHVRKHLTSADRAFLCSFGVFLFLWHASRIEADQPTPTPSPSPSAFSSQTLAELETLQQAALNERLRLPAGGASGEQHRSATKRIGAGAEGG